MQVLVAEPWSASGVFWVLHQYLGLLPLVPAVVLVARWRSLRARSAFYLVGLVGVAGVSFLLHALAAALEQFVYGATFAHPPGALWRFLRFAVPTYGAGLAGLLFLWRLSKNWTQFLDVRRSGGGG